MTATPPPGLPAWAIAIPARNDADQIAASLAALARQRDVAMADGTNVVVAVNSHDDTPRIARESRQPCSFRVIQHNTASQDSTMGEARQLAMSQARPHVRDDGILLMTDAAVVVGPTWVSAMLACFADPRIDAVAGAIAPFARDTTPEIVALETRYWQLIAAVEDTIDPRPHDPAPRHARESGSNMGIRVRAYDAIVGVPDMAAGGARAMFDAVRARDGGVRHADTPLATAVTPLRNTIGHGRRHPHQSAIRWPAATVERRLRLRKAARAAFVEGSFSRWAAQHGVADWPAQTHFGSSWAGFVARSPSLAPTPIDAAALPAQIAMLEYLLAHAPAER